MCSGRLFYVSGSFLLDGASLLQTQTCSFFKSPRSATLALELAPGGHRSHLVPRSFGRLKRELKLGRRRRVFQG